LGGSFDGRPRSGRAAALARQARANKAGAAGGGDESFYGQPQMEEGSDARPAFADLEGTQYIDLQVSICVCGRGSQVKSSPYSLICKKHKAKIKCARAAGAGKIPELLRTEVQLGRGNHHPTARCEWSL
jgi:hypothetical protein